MAPVHFVVTPDAIRRYVAITDRASVWSLGTGQSLFGWFVGRRADRIAVDARGTTVVASNEQGWIDFIH